MTFPYFFISNISKENESPSSLPTVAFLVRRSLQTHARPEHPPSPSARRSPAVRRDGTGAGAPHDTDFRARFSFALTKQLGQRHSITLDEELRLKDNWSQLDRIYTTLSYAYDVRPWFKAAAFYALIANDRGADRSMEMRHRFYLELTASYKTGAWSFSLRERPQATLHTAYVDPAVAAKTAWVLRHRLMAEYAVAGTGLKPYVFVELTQTLNAPETVGNYLEKMRSSLGAKYAFNKRSSLEFYYRFDYKISDDPVFDDFPTVDYISSERESHHMIGLEYGYKF